MELQSLQKLAEQIGQLFEIQTLISDKNSDELVFMYFKNNNISPDLASENTLVENYKPNNLFKENHRVSYYLSEDDLAFGCIDVLDSNYKIIIGPCRTTELTEEKVQIMTHRKNSPLQRYSAELYQHILVYLLDLTRIDKENFLWILSFVDNAVNHSVYPISDYYCVVRDRKIVHRQKDDLYLNHYEDKDLYEEQKMLQTLKMCLKNGDSEILTYWGQILSNTNNPVYPVFQEKQSSYLRALKNNLYSFLGELNAALYEQSISSAQIHHLNNNCTQMIEQALSVPQCLSVVPLYLKEAIGFVQQQNSNSIDNVLVQRACRYLKEHVRDNPGVDKVARSLNVSRVYLSSCFKKNVGCSMPEYVQKLKIDYAKHLLELGDYPLMDIVDYLGFSSQSYFQNVFKKLTGKTPLQYQKEYFKS